MANITDFQRKMWLVLSYMTLCKYYVLRDKQTGNFIIKKSGKIRQFFYYALWTNGVVKVTYLILAYRGYLPVEVHFLDQMGMWDWFLCFATLIQETYMWGRKYPLFEILCANWKIQETVFRKLGSPAHVEEAILKNDRSLVKLHIFVVTFGCLAIMIQNFIAPKYASNLYAVVPVDYWFLRIIFRMHELGYIYHIYVYQICSMMLCEVFASSYTHIVREMTVTLDKLIDLGKRTNGKESESPQENVPSDVSMPFKMKYICKRNLDPARMVPGTEYSIMSLLHDYQKLMIATNSFNSLCGKIMGGTMGTNYAQFVSDVFMMIQLLKEPETDFLAVFWYGEDACAGMWVMFRMLIIMSRLYPASEEFLQKLKLYVTFETPLKSYLNRYARGLRILSANLGGYKTKAITVPNGVNVLIGWYINAALWQRPADRRT